MSIQGQLKLSLNIISLQHEVDFHMVEATSMGAMA